MSTNHKHHFFSPDRPRRNRKTANIQKLLQETHLRVDNFIVPLFVQEGQNQKTSISSMPNQYRYSLDLLLDEIQKIVDQGILSIVLFPYLSADKKDPLGSESLEINGLYPTTIANIKKRFPDLTIISDVALDPYSSHGHDGIVRDGIIQNDETLERLAHMSLLHAQAGADIVAPSDMMDSRVSFIRQFLDDQNFSNTSILSYAVKYASAFYGPFRDALNSTPVNLDNIPKDKTTYQMNPANCIEAVREALLDVQEGADMLMVKPALPYLDIIKTIKEKVSIPISAYQVSGEYAMLKAASQNGWINEQDAVLESLLSIKRAGADFILTYYAKEATQWIQKK